MSQIYEPVVLFQQHLQMGVLDVIPAHTLEGLTAEDLRLLLNGVGDINVQTLISYTSFNDESGKLQLKCSLSWLLLVLLLKKSYLFTKAKLSEKEEILNVVLKA